MIFRFVSAHMKASAPLKTAARRPCVVVVVVVVATTPNYLRQASQNLGKYPYYFYSLLPYQVSKEVRKEGYTV